MSKAKEQKEKEWELLSNFIQTPVGYEWYKDCLNTDNSKKEDREHPDFIFNTKNGLSIGVEVTEFIVETKNTKYSQVLTRIGNKIYHYTKKKYGIDVSILINQYDKREFSPHWKDHIALVYDPGFSNFPSAKEFKVQLQKFVDINIEKLKEKTFVQDWITFHDEHFQISIDTYSFMNSGKFDCHVNNTGLCKEDPIDELQECINKKNDKLEEYLKECDECYLLVVLPNSSKGNFCYYTDGLLKHKYISKFKDIFFYDESKKQAYKLYT